MRSTVLMLMTCPIWMGCEVSLPIDSGAESGTEDVGSGGGEVDLAECSLANPIPKGDSVEAIDVQDCGGVFEEDLGVDEAQFLAAAQVLASKAVSYGMLGTEAIEAVCEGLVVELRPAPAIGDEPELRPELRSEIACSPDVGGLLEAERGLLATNTDDGEMEVCITRLTHAMNRLQEGVLGRLGMEGQWVRFELKGVDPLLSVFPCHYGMADQGTACVLYDINEEGQTSPQVLDLVDFAIDESGAGAYDAFLAASNPQELEDEFPSKLDLCLYGLGDADDAEWNLSPYGVIDPTEASLVMIKALVAYLDEVASFEVVGDAAETWADATDPDASEASDDSLPSEGEGAGETEGAEGAEDRTHTSVSNVAHVDTSGLGSAGREVFNGASEALCGNRFSSIVIDNEIEATTMVGIQDLEYVREAGQPMAVLNNDVSGSFAQKVELKPKTSSLARPSKERRRDPCE